MKTLTCPKLIKYVLFIVLIYTIPLFFFSASLLEGFREIGGWLCIGILICFAGMYIRLYGRAFLWVNLTNEGVSNHFCNLQWKDIKSVQLSFPCVMGKPDIRVINVGMMLCLQKDENAPQRKFLSEDFKTSIFQPFAYPLKECIFLPYNEKTASFIKVYAPHLLELMG